MERIKQLESHNTYRNIKSSFFIFSSSRRWLPPWDPHWGSLLILPVGFCSELLLQHSLLHKRRHITQTQCIDKRPNKGPPLSQVPCKHNQSPPPQLLSKIVGMPWITPQPLIKISHNRLSSLFKLIVSAHKLMELCIGKVRNNNTTNAHNDSNKIPYVQWHINRVDHIQRKAYSNQKNLQTSIATISNHFH